MQYDCLPCNAMGSEARPGNTTCVDGRKGEGETWTVPCPSRVKPQGGEEPAAAGIFSSVHVAGGVAGESWSRQLRKGRGAQQHSSGAFEVE